MAEASTPLDPNTRTSLTTAFGLNANVIKQLTSGTAAFPEGKSVLQHSGALQFLSSTIQVAPPAITSFPYLHVEPLLAECEKLLDRALETDKAAYQLGVQRLITQLDVAQFLALDTINGQEVGAGLTELPHLDAIAEQTTQKQLSDQDNSRTPLINAINNSALLNFEWVNLARRGGRFGPPASG